MFVVTGGGSGIGRALALALDARGHSVCIIGRREVNLAEVVAQGKRIVALCGDVSTCAGREAIIRDLQRYPVISALIHNAGVIEPIASLCKINPKGWQALMATNLEAPLFLTQALYSQLLGGRVLHVGSGAAHFPVAGWAAYCVSKAALAMLTRCWQLENPEIAFASVMPGIIDTDMQALIRGTDAMDEKKRQYFVQLKKNNQLLTTAVVADYLIKLLLDTDVETFVSKEWDIYESGEYAFPNE